MRKRTRHLFISFLLVAAALLYCGTALAAELQSAPLNPDFLAYLEKIDEKSSNVGIGGGGHPTGYVPHPVDFSHLAGKSFVPRSARKQVNTAPAQYDLRSLGEVPPVKDQNPYGMCWTFAAQASIESSMLKQGMGTADYSEWQLGYQAFNGTPSFDNNSGRDWPNAGGDDWIAVAVMARWDAPVLESDAPYDGPTPTGNETIQKHLQNAHYLHMDPASPMMPRYPAIDIENAKYALMNYGAISIGVYSSAMGDATVWDSATSAYYYQGSGISDHAVDIVGWDDSYTADNFATTPPGNGAWIVRNSWGSAWGDSGYFYVSYYSKGIDSGIAYAVEDVDNYDYNYQYDPLGACDTVGYDSETAWFANVFEAGTGKEAAGSKGAAGEQIKAVSFYCNSASTSNPATYNIYVYTDLPASPGNPINGTLRDVTGGTLGRTGYVTVPLGNAVYVAEEERFSIVVELTTPGYTYPIGVERPITGYTSNATASAGQSYVSSNGTTWTDMTTLAANANVCLKAFTDDAAGTHYFVTENGSGDGSSWENASSDLAGILQKAASGNEVWVAAGTYTPISVDTPTSTDREASFVLPEGVEVYGGFAGDETSLSERDISDNETILSGNIGNETVSRDNCYHVLSAVDPDYNSSDIEPEIIVDGFTIRDGYASRDLGGDEVDNEGAGMQVKGISSLVIRNCKFMNNFAYRSGGGFLSYESGLTFDNCTFQDNKAFLGGGAFVADSTNITVRNCTFKGNWAVSGSGFFEDTSSPLVEDCLFEDNVASEDAAGIASEYGQSYPIIRGCVFRNNESQCDDGVAIWFNESNPTIEDCTFENNIVTGWANHHGGGFSLHLSEEASIESCDFTGNSGAIYVHDSSYTMRNCSFTGNYADNGDQGGAIKHYLDPVRSYDITIEIADCSFTDNKADGQGGAIMTTTSPDYHKAISIDMTITNCTFTGNEGDSGGAIHTYYVEPLIQSCDFTENRGVQVGGALAQTQSNARILHSTFDGNTTAKSGGAVWNLSSDVVTTNCTYYQNGTTSPDHGGGAFANWGSDPKITNCTFTGNLSSHGSGMYNQEGSNPTITNSIFWNDRNNDIANNGDSTPTITYSVINDDNPDRFGDHNTNADPMLDTLKDNGGPTETCAIGTTGSAYDSATANGAPATDQRGEPRPSGNGYDIGAYEIQITAPTSTPAPVPTEPPAPEPTTAPTAAPTATPTSGPTPTPVPVPESEDVDSDDVTPDEDSGTVSADVEPVEEEDEDEVAQQAQEMIDDGEAGKVDRIRTSKVKARLREGSDRAGFTISDGGNEMTAQAEIRTKVLVKNQGGDWKRFDPGYSGEDLEITETADGSLKLFVTDQKAYDQDGEVGLVETDLAIVTYQAATPTTAPTTPSSGGGGGCSMGFSLFGLLLVLVPGLLAIRR
ncbi:MAG: right-handed parallel beta-helix repeat-containing protein [Synergistales bacterium]|nr:right-handed parallel beta-helix repeat-containing protein [Synergistales bacterium]